MSQKEQFEFVCKRCSHTSIFESEPPDDYQCQICFYKVPEKEHDSKYSITKNSEPKKVKLPRWWRCGNHSKTFPLGAECPECITEYAKKHFPRRGDVQVPDLNNTKTQWEIEASKGEHEFKRKVFKKLTALEQATLDSPVLLKELIENEKKTNAKLAKLIKIMENKK